MSLKCYGIVGIPKNVVVKEVLAKGGWFICFTVSSPNPDTGTFYKYPIKIWVPDNKKEEFVADISVGSVFSIETGKWAMKEYAEGKYPIPELQVRFTDFVKLERPYWYPPKEGKSHATQENYQAPAKPAGTDPEGWIC
jgi:hypothetical protein